MMKDREDIKIVLIEIQQSVVLRGIRNKLESLRYDVIGLEADLREISRYAGKVDLFVLYLTDAMTDDIDTMTVLNQMIDEVDVKGQKMILVGDKDFLVDLIKQKPNLGDFERLLLPINMDKLGGMIDQLVDDESENGRKRILIVDDDPAYAKVVRGWIGNAYQTNIVLNGTQAITFLVKNKVDLILLDYEMPVVDGTQVLQMLRQDPATEHIPVVFLTGNSKKEAVAKVMGLKPDGYILKSTTREELLKYLKSSIKK